MERLRTSNSCAPRPGEKWHICVGNQSASSARQIADKLDKIPRDTYVEPFLGLGNVYRAEKNHSGKEVLNDLDCSRTRGAKTRTCSTKSQAKCDSFKKATVTCNRDYKSFLTKYDKPSTLFYLDPPYGTKNERYEQKAVGLEDFVSNVKGIKQAKVAVSFSNNKQFKKEMCNRKTGFTCHNIRKTILFSKKTYNDILAIKK